MARIDSACDVPQNYQGKLSGKDDFLEETEEPASKAIAMNDDISVLLEFLERTKPDVHGHGLIELEPKYKALIERFVLGKCNEDERRELSRFLQLQPVWIRWLADRVRIAEPIS